MNSLICIVILLYGLFLCAAQLPESQEAQSDVEAPAYIPPYLKNHRFSKPAAPRTYSGTKTYSGRKTISGTKTNSGTKTSYGEKRTWHSSGSAPNFQSFQGNANEAYSSKCDIPCQNNGICVDRNTCQCPPNFRGQYCEFEKKPCLVYPPMPMNSDRTCSAEYCTITCKEGHKFFDGSTVANMQCTEGQWKPTRSDLTSISDCQPECNPPCENSGVCLSVNVCQCPVDFRGPQCQYPVSACDMRKLAFNGGFNCFGDSDKFSCRLHCPAGAAFSSPPVELYTCLYSAGVFEPQPIPHCVFEEVIIITPSNYHSNNPYYSLTSNETEETNITWHSKHGFTHGERKPVVVVQDFVPKGGSCLVWGGAHYKTFDGKIYSVKSPCKYILVRDAQEHKYTVVIRQPECKRQDYCPVELTVYLDEKMYMLSVDEEGSVLFSNSKRLIPIPAALPGLRVALPGDHLRLELDAGLTLQWDTNNLVVVEASVLLWNKTEGLCGTLDGNPENEMITKEGVLVKTKSVMMASWELNKIGDVCDSSPVDTSACNSKTDEDMRKALRFCTQIFSKDKFRKCSKVMDVSQLLEACQWDYCACTTSLSAEECACRTVSVYAKECFRHGVQEMTAWRDPDTCPMKCPEGKIYKACGPDTQASCAFPDVVAKANSSCVEGCFCPEGLLLESGRCVPRSECPCRIRNKSFPPGAVIPKSCNTCTCSEGAWACTAAACGARCGAVGDPHYTSFDGRRFDFMGHCTYTLLAAENITIDVENVACSGAISEAMDLAPYKGEGKPSCTKAVNLIYNGAKIHLKQGGLILVNGKEVSTLPVNVGDIRIRAASSLFIIIQLPIKVDLWWDGNTRVFVDVPPSFQDKTKGLCGTFNLNQNDDFLTPEGDVEQSAAAFANKWKTREFCEDIDTREPEHPCRANVENKDAAEAFCSKLKGTLFESCHPYVDVQPYYEDCVYDMCACAGDVSRCLCPILGDYAMACAAAGMMLQWRYHVKECEVSCVGGQQFTVCADSCARTCADVAARVECHPRCVEGCACVPGQVLDNKNECVPVGLCPCYHKGMEFQTGYREVRPGRRERELCTCMGARWECVPATESDLREFPPAEDLRSNCSAADHREFTTCQLSEPLTCKNMHLPPTSTNTECRPGCQCKQGFVLDAASGTCVPPAACPCHHGGRSYPDGDVMQEECNTCTCVGGAWACEARACVGMCGAWGDAHVRTFDGAAYDFEGVCSYLLVKGAQDETNSFCVEIQNVPCGTTGATCSKSVTLRVNGGRADEESVSLVKHAPLPDTTKLTRIKLRLAGAYVFLDVPTLGISLQWDRGLRVYVRVDAMWKDRVKGLCGNYNSDMRDDFQTPSGGGIAETSALIFADSWKLQPTCPKPVEVTDHCKERPHRQEWAASTCGALKRYPFTLCHTEVEAGAWLRRCEADACACDAGGDCECACAALAAYAHACALRGVAIKWRTQDLCPMQCDEECSNYSECMSPCPPETCDNTLEYSEIKVTCEKDTCVEGCKPNKTCAEGTVYSNSSLLECVPRRECKPVCMTLPDGREVLEGEVLTEDACHTCRCSQKRRVCTGQPCSTVVTEPTPPKETTPHDRPLACAPGWTAWVNRGPAEIGPSGESLDVERLPELQELAVGSPMCQKENMKQIECRTVTDHKTPKETGLNVECSLERGLECNEKEKTCPDFEIRVYCECEAPFQCLDSNHPNHPHPSDCGKFYECTPEVGTDKFHAVVKSCSPGLWYNPALMVCDWPASVAALRPECAVAGSTTTEVTMDTDSDAYLEGSTNPCPDGEVYVDCVYPCDQLCEHFLREQQKAGECTNGKKCVKGCVSEAFVEKLKCEAGSMWRDQNTCVPRRDCTCDYKGDIVKPGGVVTNGCEKCQCLENSLHCDRSDCLGPSHLPMIITEPTRPSTTTSTTSSPTSTTETSASTPTSTQTSPSSTVTPTSFTPTLSTLSSTQNSLPASSPTTSTTPAASTPILPTATIPTASTPIETTVSTTPILPTTVTPLIVKTTTSPPPECSPDGYKYLLWKDEPLPSKSFTASSSASALFEPQYAILNGHPKDVTAGSWNPATSDTNQFLQVELPRREPVYGVVLQGSPLFDQYVTSYDLMYGDDGSVFSTVDNPDGTPKVFRGPIDNNSEMKQMIEPPIEAKFIRIHPLSWHEDIAVRFELIGCQEPASTTTSTTQASITTLEPLQCTEPLGLASQLPVEMIEVSSNNDLRPNLNLDSERAWKPIYSTPGEWVMFNFTSPRNITGIKTKGGSNGWVSAYNIMYTCDLSTFNPILDESGKQKLFPGNFDADSVVLHEFRPPIHGQYLKVLPIKWKDNMEMRIEPIGCFEPYPTPEPVKEDRTLQCSLCPHLQNTAETQTCACAAPLHYDGEQCVQRDQCPCVLGYFKYPVGATFRGTACDQCVCKLGGVTDCQPAEQCTCEPDLVPTLTADCTCLCEPCANGTKICPTSKLCLALHKWCDGLQDCPDDERACPTSPPPERTSAVPTAAVTPPTTPTPTTAAPATTTTEKPLECPKVECPPGYMVRHGEGRPAHYRARSDELPPPRARHSYQRFYKGARGSSKGGFSKTPFSKGGRSKGGIYGPPPPPQQTPLFNLEKPQNALNTTKKQECPQFRCIPVLPPFKPGSTEKPPICSTPICPPKYSLKLEHVPHELSKCPQYSCVPPPERPVFCNVTGRSFSTFDGTEYTYDVCHHILARDSRLGAWAILVRKKCRLEGCANELLVYQDDQMILVKPSLMIEYDNYEYTVEQTSKICFQKNSFDVDRLGNGIVVKSRKYNFTILYSSDGDVKIGLYKTHMGHVDGLCGVFDGEPSNDRSLPDGSLAGSTEQFGHSWAKPGLPRDACQTKAIPPEDQKRVWDLCKVITEEPLSQCAKVLNLDKWRNICLEKICKCADFVINGTKMTEKTCRCMLVEKLVAECLGADKNIDLSGWRMQMDCPAQCPPPLVHSDCYRRRCEPRCADAGVGGARACAAEDACHPGCYCPEGTLRRGDDCVPPAACQDCTCTGVGTPAKYVTFEGDDLPFLGNCTYLASRDRNDTGHHKYQVYSTNGPCEENSGLVCTKIVHLIQEKNVVQISKDTNTKKLVTTVNGEVVFRYPLNNDWASVSLLYGQDVSMMLPDLHVELIVFQAKMEFSVRVPSFLYANKTEGLCGVCAGYLPQLVTSNGTATDDFEAYGKSWQAPPEALTTLKVPPQEQCDEVPPEPECVPPPPQSNPCYNINDVDKFGACHALVDPQPYLEACVAELCHNHSACSSLERYAADCSRQGLCLHWRRGLCAPPCEEPFVYRSCVNCEWTCENYDDLKNNPKKCDNQPIEGCFCPEGKVKVNNTCIEPTKCFPCDANKEHYAGDEWQQDACTKCACSKVPGEQAASIACTTQTCSAPVCSDLEDRITKPGAPGTCCPEYLCVLKPPDERCEVPKKIECGFGQILKQKIKADNCTEFACECKPESECEQIPDESEVEMLEPGMERVVDRSGCCPRARLTCRADACPQPPTCPQFHELTTRNDSTRCCPEYQCEPPKDKCIVKLEWEAAPRGGEKIRSTPLEMLKEPDAVWLDGPCRTCRCARTGASLAPQCSVTECPVIASTEQFVLEPRPVPFACCPAPATVACRAGDDIYRVGENWTSPYNPCESYRCAEVNDGKLEKLTTIQNCDTDCQPGWEYVPSNSSAECCGRCAPVACVIDGHTHPIDETWRSTDFCTTYVCLNVNGSLQVQCTNETCPEIPVSLKKQFVLNEEKVPGKCCPKVEAVACRENNTIYQEGQSWPSSEPCKTVKCARDMSGRLTQLEQPVACNTECARGWGYRAAAPPACCGRCVQEQCIVDDKLVEPGTTWMSADNCTEMSCTGSGDEVFVTAAHTVCPDVSACAPADIVNDTCCQRCVEKPADLSTCVPTPVPAAETVGLVRLDTRHGVCVNKEPLVGFKECRGSCDSGTLYNNMTGQHDTSCECCQALQFLPLMTRLTCADGESLPHRLASPARCACRACAAGLAWPDTKASSPAPHGGPRGRGHRWGYRGYTSRSEPDEFTIPAMYTRFAPNQY